jgi:hypothetical protein
VRSPPRRHRPRSRRASRRASRSTPISFTFGGHIETSPLVDRLRFRPSVDIGLGDDTTLVAGNFDFTYTFPGKSDGTCTSAADLPLIGTTPTTDSDTEGGFNFIVGAKQSGRLFFELKVGCGGQPRLKFGVGYTFR